MKYSNKIIKILIAAAFSLSCSIIDLSKINISVSIEQEAILEKDASIIIEFSENISDEAAPDKVKLKDYFTDSYRKIDAYWIEENKIEVVPIEELEHGRRYILSLSGSVKTSTGMKQEVDLFHSFYYVNRDPPLLLTAFTPANAETIGNFDSLCLSFSKAPNQDEFKTEFGITPSEELDYSWSEDGTSITLTAQEGWENYTSYNWSYKGYKGIFLVQQDTSPPQLLRIETGDYQEDDETFTLISSDLNLVEYQTSLRFVFSEEVDKDSLSSAFSIEPDAAGRFWQSSSVNWLFLPDEGWDQETEYTITLTSDLSDLAGNYLQKAFITSFSPAINPVTISSISVVSTTGRTLEIADLNSKTPIEINVDDPDGSCNIIINLSAGEYSSFQERNNFLESISLEGFLPPTLPPELINYEWTSESSLSLNYSGFIQALANSPWCRQTYKLTISAGKTGINNLGSYLKEEVSIVFSIAP